MAARKGRSRPDVAVSIQCTSPSCTELCFAFLPASCLWSPLLSVLGLWELLCCQSLSSLTILIFAAPCVSCGWESLAELCLELPRGLLPKVCAGVPAA